MGAVSAIVAWFIFGLMVGVIIGFLEAWKEIIFHALFGLLVIAAALIMGASVISGEAASAITVPWYDYVGAVLYMVGFFLGNTVGNQYYNDVVEALDG